MLPSKLIVNKNIPKVCFFIRGGLSLRGEIIVFHRRPHRTSHTYCNVTEPLTDLSRGPRENVRSVGGVMDIKCVEHCFDLICFKT